MTEKEIVLKIRELQKEKNKINEKLYPLERQLQDLREEKKLNARKKLIGNCYKYTNGDYIKILDVAEYDAICIIVSIEKNSISQDKLPLFSQKRMTMVYDKDAPLIIDSLTKITIKDFRKGYDIVLENMTKLRETI